MSYAYDFCSFLMQNMDENEISDMLSIILFGSVSRRTATPKSDVDIFVDMTAKICVAIQNGTINQLNMEPMVQQLKKKGIQPVPSIS